MLFYGTCVGKVVGKAMRGRDCCMDSVGIRCYVIFQETFSKWTCKFVYCISLKGGGFLMMRLDVFICFQGSVGLICLYIMLVITCLSTL